jgi:hypothetical protein
VAVAECVQEEAEDEAVEEPKKDEAVLGREVEEVLENEEVLDAVEEDLEECKKNSITFNPIHYHNCNHY